MPPPTPLQLHFSSIMKESVAASNKPVKVDWFSCLNTRRACGISKGPSWGSSYGGGGWVLHTHPDYEPLINLPFMVVSEPLLNPSKSMATTTSCGREHHKLIMLHAFWSTLPVPRGMHCPGCQSPCMIFSSYALASSLLSD